MYSAKYTIASLLVLLIMSACAEKTVPADPARVVTRLVDVNAAESECGGLLIYYDSLTARSKDELEQEKLVIRQSLLESENHCNQLRFILFSILPETEEGNSDVVNRVMESLIKNKMHMQRDEKQMVELLSDHFESSRKLNEENKEAKKQINKLNKLLDTERLEREALQTQFNEVQMKLLQLKNIEEKINAREQEISTPIQERNAP